MEEDTHNSLSPFAGITLEAILSPANLLEALKRVEANKGAPGIDGMSTEELRSYICLNPGMLTRMIREGKYRPSPVKRVSIPKEEEGKFRDLGIPTVIDRLVQQATAQVLDWHFDRTFSNRSYGFRRDTCAQFAVLEAARLANEGYRWVADIDLAKFFDTVNQSRLIRKLSDRIEDGRVVSLIHRMLRAGVEVEGKILPTNEGLAQGGPISPILANLYLDELDKELERRGHKFVRYADDLLILCRSRRAAERVMRSISDFIEKTMKLRVNRDKSRVAYITDETVKFLGHGFYQNSRSMEVTPCVHKRSKEKLKGTLKTILARNRERSIEEVKQTLKHKLRGWMNYFKYADNHFFCRSTDKWIRRRIRQILWKAWKKVKTRYKALRKLGKDHVTALMYANTRKSYWRVANSPILATSLTNEVLLKHDWSWLCCYAEKEVKV